MSRFYKKLPSYTVDSIVKHFPNIKISDNIYIFWEKPKRIPKQALDILIEILSTIAWFVASPFRLIWLIIKIPVLCLPLVVRKDLKG